MQVDGVMSTLRVPNDPNGFAEVVVDARAPPTVRSTSGSRGLALNLMCDIFLCRQLIGSDTQGFSKKWIPEASGLSI